MARNDKTPGTGRRDYGTAWHEQLADSLRRRYLNARSTSLARRKRYSGPQAVESLSPPPLVDDHRPASQSVPNLSSKQRLGLTGVALTTVALLLLAFFLQLFILSPLYYYKQQQIMFDDFRYALANATAPVGQVSQDDKLLAVGTPVALITANSIGLNAVVVEGTTSSALTSGPGHRRDTPLPGQYGASVIYGRQFSYGGPFSRIHELKTGDQFTVTTGQGVHKYTVSGVRYTGDPIPPASNANGTLTLVSASGVPLLPNSVVRVDATLNSNAMDTPVQMFSVESLAEGELPMFGEAGAWGIFGLEIFFIALLIIIFWISGRFWGRLQTWVVSIPVILAIGIATAMQVTFLLPNLI